MIFKDYLVKTAQLLFGLVLLAFLCAFAGLLVKTAYNLFMYGFRVW